MSAPGLLVAIVTFIVGLFARGFFPSYMREKGKNLATKEDIAPITELIERIRTDNASALQRQAHQDQQSRDLQDRTHSLRLVAAEKRLAALQEAYSLWKRLLGKMYGPNHELSEMVLECQEWWNTHCLYLDEKARSAFFAAYSSAVGHKDFLVVQRSAPDSVKNITANWDRIVGAGAVIVESAALPSMSQLEERLVGIDQGAMGTTDLAVNDEEVVH